jgi:hypothetical protein
LPSLCDRAGSGDVAHAPQVRRARHSPAAEYTVQIRPVQRINPDRFRFGPTKQSCIFEINT